MPRLQLTFLGTFHATLDGQPLTRFGSAKTQGLLAYLALAAGQPQARAVLATLLWPEESESAAAHNLRQAIYHLRHLLEPAAAGQAPGEPFLLITRQTLQFNPASDYELDVVRFLELSRDDRPDEAAAHYRGDLLAGLVVDSVPFEEWQRSQREQLHRLALNLLSQLTGRDLQQGLFDRAQHQAQRQLELDPWSEPAHRQLMQALWLAGERSAALAQFEACCRILAAELGVPPHAETLALAQQIRDGRLPARVPQARSTPQHNLPAPLTSIVGREAELAEIQALLAREDCRLVTITGMGGIGKTRLALAVARAQLDAGWQEVYHLILPPVAQLTSPEALAHGVMQALEVARPDLSPQKAPAHAALLHLWRSRSVLLVLDNCETILAGGEWLGDLLAAAPGLKILALSRQRLNLRAEWVVALQPLRATLGDRTTLALSPAAQLFVERAGQARPQFRVTAQNLPWIDQICQLLDGLPLGLELAAAQVRRYTTRQIAQQLAASTSTLTSDEADRPARHRSLTGVFESSLVQRTPPERQAFQRLAVFQRGFTLDAAQAVADTTPATLFSLVDSSLLGFDAAGQRFLRHPLLYAYALEKLHEAPDEEQATRARHAAYFAAFLNQRREGLRGFGQAAALRDIEAELDNVLAAWQWAVDRRRLDLLTQAIEPLHDYHLTRGLHEQGEQLFGKAAESVRRHIQASAAPAPAEQAMVCALLARKVFYLYARGRFLEAVETGRAIEQAGDTCPGTARVMAYRWCGNALVRLDRLVEARHKLEESLALSRTIGDAGGQVEALRSLVNLYMTQGDQAAAWRLFDQVWALRGQARARDEWLIWRLRGGLATLGHDFAQALDAYQQALACAQQIEDSFAQLLIEERLGETYLGIGQLATAHDFLARALAGFRRAGAGEYQILASFHLSRVLVLTGQPASAAQLLRESLDLAQQLGSYRQIERIQAALHTLTASPDSASPS
jgi:DNA-binding SARP family transcriptional activator